MLFLDSSCLNGFYHAINIVLGGLELKNQVITMLKPNEFFFGRNLTVGVFGVSSRTKSVKYGVDDTHWDTVDVFQLYKRCYSFTCRILFKSLWLLKALFKIDLREVQ